MNQQFIESELNYLKTIRFLKPSYIEFLRLYKANSKHVKLELLSNGELDITIEGPWFSTIYWEVPLLAIINEVYMSETYQVSPDEYAQFFLGLQVIRILEGIPNSLFL